MLHAVAVAGPGLLEELDPADIDGRQLIAKLTPQPPIGAVREFSPWIDSPKMIELMKLNGIRGTSDTAIKRSKKLWQAEPQVGRHNQLFHFRLATLRELRIKYPPEWDNPPN